MLEIDCMKSIDHIHPTHILQQIDVILQIQLNLCEDDLANPLLARIYLEKSKILNELGKDNNLDYLIQSK